MNAQSTNAQSLTLAYEGSVKRVWRSAQNSEALWFEFTDDYSVFDWGKMPDKIANKGRSLALLGGFMFDRLARPDFWKALPNAKALEIFDKEWLQARFNHYVFSGPEGLTEAGARTHFSMLTQNEQKLHDLRQAVTAPEPILMQVMRADVFRPTTNTITGNTVYFYPSLHAEEGKASHLIPLEIVFRFGMPPGSSLPQRLAKDPTYFQTLNLSKPPIQNVPFEHPVLEFYTKLEPKDRLLSLQEASLMSGLSPQQFENMVEYSLDLALALFFIFSERGIDLWDGKFEMILVGNKLLLADSIGPDELRLLYKGCHLSKEIIRQIYRGTAWEMRIKEAQARSRQIPGSDWREICEHEFEAAPEPLSPEYKKMIDQLYPMLINHLLKVTIFENQPTLEEFVASVPDELLMQSYQPMKV